MLRAFGAPCLPIISSSSMTHALICQQSGANLNDVAPRGWIDASNRMKQND
jgi:hypothetical protein